MNSIYYEPQRGGMCRMHALNAFFGRPELDEQSWAAKVAVFDKTLAGRQAYKGMSFADWDFQVRGMNAVSMVLLEKGVFARYYAIGELRSVSALNPGFSFCFNQGHIWGIRKVGEQWFKVDSIGGVSAFGAAGPSLSGVGFMVPSSPIRAFYECIAELHELVGEEKSSCEPALARVASIWTWMASRTAEPPAFMSHFLERFALFEETLEAGILEKLAADLRRKYAPLATRPSAKK